MIANLTLCQPRANHPPHDQAGNDRAYSAATLARRLAEPVDNPRTGAGLTQTELAGGQALIPKIWPPERASSHDL